MANTESEQFSLRWNNFHSNLTAGFHALLEEVDLVDVTLAAGGQFVQAHKIVLSVCSPYFKQLFKVNPCKHPIVILKDVCHKELEAILQFMYQGEVNVRQEELSTFLKTAEMLQIKGLTGHDSPTNNTPTSAPAPMHRPTREKPVHTEPVSLKQDEPHPRPYKRPRTDPPLPVATAPPTPTFAPVAPQPVSPPSVSEDTSGVEFIEMTKPKDEPIEYESDLEELDTKLPVRDDPLVQLLQGETSQSHHDSTQGPPTGMFASIPGLSQDSGGSQDGLQDNTPCREVTQIQSSAVRWPGMFTCKLCNKEFSWKNSLQTHILNIHGNLRGPFPCHICGKMSKNKKSLSTHIHEFHKKMNYKVNL